MSFVNQLPGANDPMSFQLSRYIDHLTAMFALIMTVLHVIPLHEKIRKLLLVISLLWIILFLSGGNESIALIPSFLLLVLLIVFWFTIRGNKEKGFFTRNKMWALSVVFMVAAVVCFKIVDEPYWIMHSLWHIFSSFSAALLLASSALCFQSINLDQIKFPRAMLALFTNPYECR
jgi:hypothetical protein